MFAALILLPPAQIGAQDRPVAAIVETTLTSAPGQIRQFAFDGDPETYFASANNADKRDHFTLVFDVPVALKSVSVTTGKPKGGDALETGILEFSADGKVFTEMAKFADGVARGKSADQKVTAIRVKPTSDLQHPLVIREFVVDSEPRVAVFKYPVEFIVDVSDAPEMKPWADKVARICERNYRMINDELPSEGFKPRTVVYMALKNSYKGVAQAGGGRITGSVKYFKSQPEDLGAMIHETAHIVQSYRAGGPSWLVEGIADYVRFFKYEPGKIGKIANDPHYNNSYRTSAAFLNFVSTQYDKELVRKLNKALREGEYRETIWTSLTKKTLKELDEEWRASMKKGPAKVGAQDSREFRRLDELHRHLLDQDDFLGGHVMLLQNPLQVPQTGDRFGILQGVDNQQDVMIDDRLVSSIRQPGAGPGWEAFEAGLRATAKTGVE
jgi:basic secretory peptidase family protein